MKIDRNTGTTYKSYWDWLRRHPLFIIVFFFAYGWYLGSTEKYEPTKKKQK